VKSREDRRREAKDLGLWLLGAVAALLALYVLVEGTPTSGTAGLGPVIGASLGAGVTYMLTLRQRREEEHQRRRALATALLSELRFLEMTLQHHFRLRDNLIEREIYSFQTAVYDQAGANLLLFTAETVYTLHLLYQRIYDLRADLIEFRLLPPDEDDHTADPNRGLNVVLCAKATYAAQRIAEVAARLQEEGGMWPPPIPMLISPMSGGMPDMPPPVFARSDPSSAAAKDPS
jgi:hypothetical protein